jgi:hypothetical protein
MGMLGEVLRVLLPLRLRQQEPNRHPHRKHLMGDIIYLIIGIPCVVIVTTVLYCAASMIIEVMSAPVYLIDTLIERHKNK